jgi:hypothetical protein
MKAKSYTFTAKLWLYPGKAGWVFATVPKKETTMIKEQTKGLKRGWGSVPVTVTLGKTTWETSIFPDNRLGTYLLPIKALVRKKEEVMDDDVVTISLRVRSL